MVRPFSTGESGLSLMTRIRGLRQYESEGSPTMAPEYASWREGFQKTFIAKAEIEPEEAC